MAYTRQQVLELVRDQTTTTVPRLAAALGMGQNQIYESIARGEWTTTRVLRSGRNIKIPTSDIAAALGIDVAEPVSA